MDPIQPNMPEAAPKKNLGPIIGIIVIVILLIIGALYMWGEKLSGTDSAALEQTVPAGSGQVVGADDQPLSTSDDLNVLEAELNNSGTAAVDLSNLE